MLAAVLLSACAQQTPPLPCTPLDDAGADTGIKPQGLYVDGLGRSSELRYWVTDKAKASFLFEQAVQIELLREPDGPRYRSSVAPRPGNLAALRAPGDERRLFHIRILHPGFELKPGDSVAVVIGDAEIRCLTVQAANR